jgi:hypothetical protein
MNSLITEGKNSQCEYCQRRDITLVAKTGYGPSEKSTQLLGADHVVYLALFSENLIKVGVDLWDRRQIRVTEQGAIASIFIARGSGTVARNLESRIRRRIGFTEWVRSKTKLSGLGSIIDTRKAEIILKDSYDKVLSNANSTAIINLDYTYLADRYSISDNVGLCPIEYIETVSGGATIFGTIAGIYGKIILLINGKKLYALDSSLICGYSLTKPYTCSESSDLIGITTKLIDINLQQSLF